MRRGSSSRGARGTPANPRGSSTRGRGRGALSSSGPTSKSDSDSTFEKDRNENAAIREQKGQLRGSTNVRGNGRGGKTVRFEEPPAQFNEPTNPSPTFSNPFAQVAETSPFATPSIPPPAANANPFARPSNSFTSLSSTPPPGNTIQNHFHSKDKSSSPSSNPFNVSKSATSSPFATLSNTRNGSIQQSSNFGGLPGASSQPSSIFLAPQSSVKSQSSLAVNPFANPKTASANSAAKNLYRPGAENSQSSSTQGPLNLGQANATGFASGANHLSIAGSSTGGHQSASKLAMDIDSVLRNNGIIAPSWPTSTPGDPGQKAVVEGFWQTTKAYRAKVRTCLIRNGFLDDPEKPKKLSEAIDFKGTCEGMCPDFEKITRIMEHDVQSAEKDFAPDGHTLWPSLSLMVKALARSAAGQDAPLPDDVRSPAALRRTLDYLINDVLGKNDLPTVHGFLWDRTRAIRRDFVFQQSSLSPEELLDQVYCLEHITRFHVIALHQMSHEDVAAEDFSEQQEVEQLGKALLSLIHSYEDCNAQNIQCENEAEFRAYYVLFNVHNTAILEAVQDWGWKFWGESDDIKTAVSLAENLHNIWDMQGPLNPQSPSDVAQNLFSRFFSVLEDTKVSYTMACFAEIHFNKVRKAALKTILASYRKQRDQTRDWTLSKLNTYLQFDNEQDIVAFGEAYGLHFEEFEKEEFLSFESDDSMVEPFPQLKQYHSYNFVERKRGDFTLPDAISRTVYEEEPEEDDGGLFVPEARPWQLQQKAPELSPTREIPSIAPTKAVPEVKSSPWPAPSTFPPNLQAKPKPADLAPSSKSVFDSNLPPPTGGNIFRGSEKSSIATPAVINAMETAAATPQPQTSTASIFSFLRPSQAAITATGNYLPKPLPSPFAPMPNGEKNSTVVLQDQSQTAPSNTTQLDPSTVTSSTLPKADSQADIGSGVPTFHKAQPTDPRKGVSESSPSPVGAFQVTKEANSPALLFAIPTSEVAVPQPSGLPEFAKWFALGDGGIVDQFTEMLVHAVLIQAVNQFTLEEETRIKEEEDRKSREEAAQFRVRSLATKYVYLWQKNAHLLWMRRKGRRARELRKQMAEEAKILALAQKKDVVEEFRFSTENAGRKSLEDMLSATGVLNGVHEPEATLKSVIRRDEKGEVRPGTKSLTKSHTPTPRKGKVGNNPGHRRGQSESPMRRSTFINDLKGGSRIHLLRNWTPETDRLPRHPQPNAVRTDYFRLKARGIITLPDGSPMADPTAVNLLYERKALEEANEANKPDPPPLPPPKPFSWSTRFVDRDAPPPETPEEIEVLKARAREIMAADKEEKDRKMKKRRVHTDDDDEALFAQAKRVREQMDEGRAWYRAEIEKETVSGSSSGRKRSI